MNLSEDDVKIFFKVYKPLLWFSGFYSGYAEDNEIESLSEFSHEDYFEVRRILFSNWSILDEFLKVEEGNFNSEEIEILKGFKNGILDRFIIYRFFKNYAVFLGVNQRAYKVRSLEDKISEIVGKPPCLATTALLPFKNIIVCDGLIAAENIAFGKGMREGFKNEFEEAVSKFGLIDRIDIENSEISARERLRGYLKSEKKFQEFQEEIILILEANPELESLFHLEYSKLTAKRHKKELKQIGLHSIWFAVLHGKIVGADKDKKTLTTRIKDYLPENTSDIVHYFKV